MAQPQPQPQFLLFPPKPTIGSWTVGGPVGGPVGGLVGGLVGPSKLVFPLRNSLISEFGSWTIGGLIGGPLGGLGSDLVLLHVASEA